MVYRERMIKDITMRENAFAGADVPSGALGLAAHDHHGWFLIRESSKILPSRGTWDHLSL